MNDAELKDYVIKSFQMARQPLDKDKAIRIYKNCLADYPKQLQQFGDWFDQNSDFILNRINSL